MKKVSLAAAIAMTLFSGAVLAEQGSGQLNQIEQPASAVSHHSNELTLAPTDLTAVNGDAAKNEVMQVSSSTQASLAQGSYAPSELNAFNS